METCVTKKVSIVLPPLMEVNVKVRIREKARELFMRYGIRSVSMDDIAAQLGMSKKTIYQYFADKNELVMEVMEAEIVTMQSECLQDSQRATNAVDEIFIMVDRITEQFRSMNPVIIYDLEKFHVRAYQRFLEYRNKFLLDIIRKNLQWGVKEGLYRPEIDIELLAKFRLESMMIAFNIDLFPPSKYNLAQVTREIIEHFVYGVASPKGYKLILKCQQKRSKNINEYENISGKVK
jgi:AcrR family transcriptional regulator